MMGRSVNVICSKRFCVGYGENNPQHRRIYFGRVPDGGPSHVERNKQDNKERLF